MNSPGNPYHNAQAVSLMKTLKVEQVYISGYETFGDVAVQLPRFIEKVYNAKRLRSALGYQSSDECETQLVQQVVRSDSGGPAAGVHTSTPFPPKHTP